MNLKLEGIPPFDSNWYYQQNSQMFLNLLDFYESYPKSFSRMLERPKYQQLRNWIDEVTGQKLSNHFYTIGTKVAWILFGVTGFPKCKTCLSDEHYKNINVSPRAFYRPYCSYKCAGRNQETLNKQRLTFQRAFGVDWPMQSRSIQQKSVERCLQKYNVRNVSQIDSVKTKKVTTVIKNFGESNKFNHQKATLTWSQKSPEELHAIYKKRSCHYTLDSINFDSAPELAFYIWHRDHNIEFEYQPSISFEYEFDGKKFRYFPDFKVGDKLYEIKGDQFFKEDGTMFLPYRKKSWSDERYEWMCKKYEAKHQCMLANNVVVLTSKDYQAHLKYVSDRYGCNYLKHLRSESKIVNR